MNVLVKTIGAGIFSTFVIALQSIYNQIENLENINSIYIEFDENSGHGFHSDNNPYNFILEQTRQNFDIILQGCVYPDHVYQNISDILNTDHLRKMHLILSKIKFKQSFLDKINNDINHNTLGVHVRATDMVHCHPEYIINERNTNNYFEKINQIILENPNINNIFVASDNIIILNELKQKMPNIIYNHDINNRFDQINDFSGSYVRFQRNNLSNEKFWIDSFLEMYSLSKCGYLLYSISNLSHTSVLISNNISKIYKL
jgi:hypothetical protein